MRAVTITHQSVVPPAKDLHFQPFSAFQQHFEAESYPQVKEAMILKVEACAVSEGCHSGG